SVTGSTITNNDMGVYNLNLANSAPTKSQTSITKNKFVNRYEGVVLDQGYATVNNNTFSGGEVGIYALQYDGQDFGTIGSVSHATVNGVSVAAVQVASDQVATDYQVKLTISSSKLSGNPQEIVSNSVNSIINTSKIS